jgi:Holliday junction resolvase RusA-like endonuclease
MSLPEKKGTMLSFSVLCPENTTELRGLMSRNISMVISEQNGHVAQEPLPLPVASEPPTEPLVIVIKGQPMGKPRMTDADRWKRRDCVLRYWAWCEKARKAADGRIEGRDIETLSVKFYFAMPKDWSNAKRLQHDGKRHFQTPDIDNCVKSVMDSLVANDEIIARIDAEKFWTNGEPYTEVTFSK